MIYIWNSFLLSLVFTYLGLGLSLWLCPQRLKKYALLLAPAFGFAYLTLVGWFCYVGEVPGTDRYAAWVLAPPLLFLAAGWFLHPAGEKPWRALFHPESLLAWLAGFGVQLAFAWPYVAGVQGMQLTSLSIGNYDLPDAATVATFLKEFHRHTEVGFIGQTQFLWNYTGTNIFGGPLATAFGSTLLNLQTYQVQSMSINVFLFFALLAGYALAREGFGYRPLTAAFLMVLVAFNPLTMYSVYHGFQGHLVSLPLTLTLVLLNLALARVDFAWRDFPGMTVLLALINWGLALTYPHVIVLTYLPLGTYLLVVACQEKQWRRAGFWAVCTVAALVLLTLASHHFWYMTVVRLLARSKDIAGWFHPLLAPDVVFGFFRGNLNLPYFEPRHPVWQSVGASAAALLFIGYGLKKSWDGHRQTGLLSALWIGYILAGYLLLAYAGREQAGWGGYKSYKFIAYYVPLLLLAGLRGYEYLLSFKRGPWLYAAALLLLLLPNGRASYKIIKLAGEGHLMVTQQMAELKNLERDDRIRSINILHNTHWEAMWEVNFLLRKRLYLKYKFCHGRVAMPLEGEWDMVKGEDIPRLSGPAVIRLNGQYAFVPHVPEK